MKNETINKRVGEQIRMIRLSKNLSQESLSDELKISVSTLSNLERGTTEFTITRLFQIIDILQIDILDFFTILLDKSQENISTSTNNITDKLQLEINLIKLELEKLRK